MKDEVECCSVVRRIVNIFEFHDELVYIRLDDDRKFLLNADGCWRCGTTASCFGNMEESVFELEVVCKYDFFDEVRSLFLCLLQDMAAKLANWLSERATGRLDRFMQGAFETFGKVLDHLNIKKSSVCGIEKEVEDNE